MYVVTEWTDRDCRALREALGLTQAQFGDQFHVTGRTVIRWEKGKPIGKQGQIDLSTRLASLTRDQAEAFRCFRDGGDPAAALSDPSGLIIRRLDGGAGRPDVAVVALIRSTLHAAMELDDKLGSPAAIGLVTAQQHLTEAMLRDCRDELRPALMSLRAEWRGLAGVLAADEGDHATAAQCYEDAREYAHDAEDDDLAAYMLCHMSQLAIWQQRRRIAVDHAVAARAWVAQSPDRRLRAYAAIRMADAAALAGQQRAALAALEDAETALDGLSACSHPSESRAYFVGPGLLESYQGLVRTHLGMAVPAEIASRRAVAQIPPHFPRDRAMTLIELARPLVLLDQIDEAAKVVAAAAELTEQNRSPRLTEAVIDARRRLAPWSTTPAVRDLDEQLIARDIVST